MNLPDEILGRVESMANIMVIKQVLVNTMAGKVISGWSEILAMPTESSTVSTIELMDIRILALIYTLTLHQVFSILMYLVMKHNHLDWLYLIYQS